MEVFCNISYITIVPIIYFSIFAKTNTIKMKQILYLFSFCTLLALGFTACQQEEDAFVQLSLEDLQKRDSKKHPKLEYATTVNNNSADSPPSLKCIFNEGSDVLQISIQKDTYEKYSIAFKNGLGFYIFKEEQVLINEERAIQIAVSENFPCSFMITSKTFDI